MTITLTRLKESLPVHAPYIKEGFRTCSLTDLLAILTWNISPRGKIAPRPTTAEVPQQGGQQAMHVISRAADHYLVGLTAKDCPATPRHNACDTQHLRMEVVTRSPPDKLRALVEGLRTELEEDVKNVLARNIQTIEKPKGTWDGVLKEFFEDYKRNHASLPVIPSRPHRGPTLFVLQAGDINIGTEPTMVVVFTLFTINTLRTEIKRSGDAVQASNQSTTLDWGPPGTINWIPGASQLRSSGPGRLACLWLSF
ncbi:hypothetical protein RBB50_012149 [Rhinocladiella similis]